MTLHQALQDLHDALGAFGLVLAFATGAMAVLTMICAIVDAIRHKATRHGP